MHLKSIQLLIRVLIWSLVNFGKKVIKLIILGGSYDHRVQRLLNISPPLSKSKIILLWLGQFFSTFSVFLSWNLWHILMKLDFFFIAKYFEKSSFKDVWVDWFLSQNSRNPGFFMFFILDYIYLLWNQFLNHFGFLLMYITWIWLNFLKSSKFCTFFNKIAKVG